MHAFSQQSPPTPLPAGQPAPTVGVLYVAAKAGGGRLLADAVAPESAEPVRLLEAVGPVEALEQLAAQPIQAIYLHPLDAPFNTHDLVAAIRTGGFEQPIVILASDDAQNGNDIADWIEAGADVCCSLDRTTPRALWAITCRAMEQAKLASEGRRLIQAQHRRLAQEHREAERLLAEQRRLIGDLQSLGQSLSVVDSKGSDAGATRTTASDQHARQFAQPYHDLLQAHVIMGDGHLAEEISALARELIAAGMTGRQAIDLHLSVVEKLVAGLAARSARHVINRADLMVLELMVHLVDGYRQQYDDRPAA